LTLDVETPEGVKKGSGVLEVRAFDTTNQIGRIDSARGGATTVGEAVVVDLGACGQLFALLTGRGKRPFADELSANAAARAGGFKIGPGLYTDFARRVAQAQGEIEVLPEELPMLVRFRDIADPKSVEAVDPNDLAKSFGPGVKLLRATIEMTSDPVTTRIEKRLGWLNHLDRYRTDATNPFTNTLPPEIGGLRSGF
jgi:hypothetical protein